MKRDINDYDFPISIRKFKELVEETKERTKNTYNRAGYYYDMADKASYESDESAENLYDTGEFYEVFGDMLDDIAIKMERIYKSVAHDFETVDRERLSNNNR